MNRKMWRDHMRQFRKELDFWMKQPVNFLSTTEVERMRKLIEQHKLKQPK